MAVTESTPLDQLVGSWLTLPDVADRLGLDVGKVRRLLQEGRLAAVRRGDPRVLSVPEAFLVPGHLANPSAPSREATGNFYIDDEVLAEEGITDLSAYGYGDAPDADLQLDIFLDE